MESPQEKEDARWHQVLNAHRTRKILTGTLSGIEKLESGWVVAVTYYNNFRIIIPMDEMMINLNGDGRENADILKRQITEGHAIANHSLSHNFNLLYPGRVPNQSQIVSEVNQTMANFQAILGKDFKTRIFRYPGGHMSWQGLESTDQALAKEGVQWIDWNMLCGDAEPASVRPTTSESMMAYLDGSQKYFPESHVKVVLMHDTAGKELTVQTLPQIIEYFKDQGYTFGVLE